MSRNVYLGLGVVLLGTIWSGCLANNVSPDGQTGGSIGTTGGQSPSTGGLSSGGASTSTGGTNATGGATTTGGATSTGGSVSSGGAPSTGGGGVMDASGGTGSSGGNSSSGGSSTGGSAGSGNSSNGGSGGKASTGGQGSGGGGRGGSGGTSTGGNSTGGVTSTPCPLSGSPNPGSGSFTYYYFSQGTYKDTNSGKYQTACGYLGTANGMTDTVENVGTPNYFVAIPGKNSTDFANNKHCGSCVQLTNGGNSVVATVIDECPQDSNPKCINAHLDVSKAAFDKLGYANGNPSGTTWKFVPCPVTGNVKVRMKNGNPNEIYIENLFVALQSVTMDGVQANRQSYGAWHFNGNISAGAMLMLTDVVGRTLTVTVTSTTQGMNQDTGKQFPTCQQ